MGAAGLGIYDYRDTWPAQCVVRASVARNAGLEYSVIFTPGSASLHPGLQSRRPLRGLGM
jgi:hypothetical protein